MKWSHEPPRAQDVPGAIARAIHHAIAAPAGAGVRVDPDGRLGRRGRRGRWPGTRSAARSPVAPCPTRRRSTTWPSGRLHEAAATRCSSPAPTSTPPAAGTRRWRWPRSSAWRCGRRPRRAAAGSASPRTTRKFVGVLPPAIGAGRPRRSRATTSCSSSAPRCSPTTRTSPARCCPRAPALVQITSDPARPRARRWATRSSATWRSRSSALVALLGRPPSATPPEPRPAPGDPRRPTRSAAQRRWPRWRTPGRRTGSRSLEAPSSTMALRNRLRLSRPGQLLLRRQRRPRLRHLGRGRGSARAARASGRVRARRGLRPVRHHRPVDAPLAYRVPVTFLVLRNEEYMILKWFAELEQVERRARARPARPRRRRRGQRLRRAGAARSTDARSSTEALREAIAAEDGPRLIQVPVASGMWLE